MSISELIASVVRSPVVFVMEVRDPDETLRKLSTFFYDRKIIIDAMQMQRYRGGDASVIIHCSVEKDRIKRTYELLTGLPGVKRLEKFEKPMSK
jgi:hypothetical protein